MGLDIDIESIKLYLPKYLSPDSESSLFEGLKDFPSNIDSRLYTSFLKDTEYVYQGDGMHNMLAVNMNTKEFKDVPSIILSNTCDIDPSNIRVFNSQVIYAPIINLAKYEAMLLDKMEPEKVKGHIDDIKKQRITQIFYLPELSDVLNESIVFLDRVQNVHNKSISKEKIITDRFFTLSNYGVYMFLLKLSIHFTRIQEGIDRDVEQ